MAFIVNRDTTWEECKRGRIGGGCITRILGCSPWGGRWETWLEMTGRLNPKDLSGVWLYWGDALEPALCKRYREMYPEHRVITPEDIDAQPSLVDELGLQCDLELCYDRKGRPRVFIRDFENPRFQGSPDAFLVTDEGLWIIDWKTVGAFKGMRDWDAEVVPDVYSVQGHWYASIAGALGTRFVIFQGTHADLEVRDDLLQFDRVELARREAEEFLRLVDEDVEPAREGPNLVQVAKAMLRTPEAADVTLPPSFELLFRERESIKEAQAELKIRKDAIDAEFAVAVAGAKQGVVEGTKITVALRDRNRKGYTVEPASYTELVIRESK